LTPGGSTRKYTYSSNATATVAQQGRLTQSAQLWTRSCNLLLDKAQRCVCVCVCVCVCACALHFFMSGVTISPLPSGYALTYFCGKSCSVSVRLYIVMTSVQAQAFRSNWSDLPPELLDTIAQRIARDRAAVQPFRRKLCSAGYSSLLPICNKWMQLASAYIPPCCACKGNNMKCQ